MRQVGTMVLALALAGCASTSSDPDAQRVSGDRSVLTQEEFRGSGHSNLYDVVQALRPSWLVQRGPISLSDPEAGRVVVYVNNVQAGGVEYLRQVNVLEVVSLRYLDPLEASAQFGLKQSGGAAIIINTGAGR
jgi:hypothetical protein